ncbi:MAG: Cell division protein FtsA [Firmicutes bacterium]|nr:Cell division protein FtsA [Bacillota bacterium]
MVATPPGTVENGVVKDGAKLQQALRAAQKMGRFKARRAITVLTGQNLLLRQIELPPMPPKELRAAIAWQFEQYFQLRLADMLTDYQVISGGRGKPSKVLLVAMQREPVLVLVDNLRRTGLLVQGVDIEPLAALRAVKLCRQAEAAEQAVAVIDFGAGTTNISLFIKGLLASARIVNIGGNDFTRAIMNLADCDWTSAESAKMESGWRLDSDIAPAVIPLRDRLFSEINKTLDYYFAENRELGLEKVIVMGGGCTVAGLLPQLENYLYESQRSITDNFVVELCNPLRVIAHPLPKEEAGAIGPALAVALGLVLGEVSRP